MGTLLSVIVGVCMLMTLVVLHELGHFWTAKKLGVKVLEFGIGIPPKVYKFWADRSGTEYTLNAIPLGGFVRLKGEDPSDESEFLATDSLITASLWRKIIILLGGIVMNLLTTYVLFVIVFMVGVTPFSIVGGGDNGSYLSPSAESLYRKGYISSDITTQPVTIQEVYPNTWASNQGIRAGDVIMSIDGITSSVYEIPRLLASYRQKSVLITIQKPDGSIVSSMYECKDLCQLGVVLQSLDITPVRLGGKAWSAAWNELGYQSRSMFAGLGKIGKGLISFNKSEVAGSLQMMSGPAGVIKVGKDVANSRGWSGYLAFAGLISLSLALFNLLPIPALDGGRVVGSIIQSIGRFSPQKYFIIEGYINTFFFVLLMGLGIYVLGQDLIKVWGIFG